MERIVSETPSEIPFVPLQLLTLQPGLKRGHGSLAIQHITRYTGKQEEDRGEASGSASVALRLDCQEEENVEKTKNGSISHSLDRSLPGLI